MKYDDASWHYGGDFPSDLPPAAGGTHIAIFLTWCLLNGMAGDLHLEWSVDDMKKLQQREITPGQFLFGACDEKFTNEDLSKLGNDFAAAYFDYDKGNYLKDYFGSFPNTESLYHVPDTWETYDVIAPIILKRFEAFQSSS
ncbi:MAG: hypothetical protein AAFY34_14840 [Pseudomonadota bacterium]